MHLIAILVAVFGSLAAASAVSAQIEPRIPPFVPPPVTIRPAPGQPVGPALPNLQVQLVSPHTVSVSLGALADPALRPGAAGEAPAVGQPAVLNVVVGGLHGARSVRIRVITGDGLCEWQEQTGVITDGVRVVSPVGEVTSTTIGAVIRGGATCSFHVTVGYAQPPRFDSEAQIELVTSAVPLTPRRSVRLTTFDQIDRLLGFALEPPSIGTCSGRSEMLGGGSFPVGMLAGSQGRFTFAVRSGPIGTQCTWRSELVTLPPGVEPVALDVVAAASDEQPHPTMGRSATCAVSGAIAYVGSAAPMGGVAFDFARGTVPLVQRPGVGLPFFIRGFTPLLTEDNVTLAGRDGASRFLSLLVPMRAQLLCGRTLVNDHYATLTIRSMDFLVPDNVAQFP